VEKLFDLSEEYDAMLNKGLKYSGEDKFFFLKNRVETLKRVLPKEKTIKKILDFGCGIGDTSQYLLECFPEADIYGVDTAHEAIEYARERFSKINFSTIDEFDESDFDLCYCNGVFHHILPPDRKEALAFVHSKLTTTGIFSMFENNPLNIGTRFIMSRIPFDRDAVPIYPRRAKKMFTQNNFNCIDERYLFIFPNTLKFLRFTESWFEKYPLGAQYLILAQKK